MGNPFSKRPLKRDRTPLARLLRDTKVRPALLENMQVDYMIVARMAEYLTFREERIIKHHATMDDEKADILLTCVSRGGMKAYSDLLNALKDGQQGIIDILQKGERQYGLQEYVSNTPQASPIRCSKGKDTRNADEIRKRLVACYHRTAQHHQVLKDSQAFSQFTNDLTIHFTNLILEKNEHDGHMKLKREGVSLDHLLQLQTSKNIIFTGGPGAGKSSIILQILFLWCELQEGTAEMKKKLEKTFLRSIKQIIYLPPKLCADSLNGSLRRALCNHVGPNLGSEAFTLCDSNRNVTALLIDSLDEVDSFSELLNQVKEEMLNGEYMIIAGVRHLHQASHMFTDVHPTIFVAGFSEENIFNFISKYFSERTDECEELKGILKSNDRIRSLLCNPLLLIIVATLAYEKSITIDELADLNEFKIFCHLERLISVRESIEGDALKELHELALNYLLQSEEPLFTSDVSEMVHKLPFLNIETNLDLLTAERGQLVTWTHRAFCEFSASKFLNECEPVLQSSAITIIAATPGLNYILANIIHMMRFTKEEYIGLVNTVISMQSKISSIHGEADEAPEGCTCMMNDVLKINISQITSTQQMKEEAPHIIPFTNIHPCPCCLPCNDFWATVPGLSVIANVFTVLESMKKEDQVFVFEETIGRLLPATCTNDEGVVTTILPAPDRAGCVVLYDGIVLDPKTGFRFILAAPGVDVNEALHLPYTQPLPLEALNVNAETISDTINIYSTQPAPPQDRHHYDRLLSSITNSPCLVGRGELDISLPPSHPCEDVYSIIVPHLQVLYDWGMRLFILVGGTAGTAGVNDLLEVIMSAGWVFTPGRDIDGDPCASLVKGKQKVDLGLWDTRISHDSDKATLLRVRQILHRPKWF